jgi:hypothetical protein
MLLAVATCLAGFDEILTLQWGASQTGRPFHLENLRDLSDKLITGQVTTATIMSG